MDTWTVVACDRCRLVAPPLLHREPAPRTPRRLAVLGPLPKAVALLARRRRWERRCASCGSVQVRRSGAIPSEAAVQRWRVAQGDDDRRFRASALRACALSAAALAAAAALVVALIAR